MEAARKRKHIIDRPKPMPPQLRKALGRFESELMPSEAFRMDEPEFMHMGRIIKYLRENGFDEDKIDYMHTNLKRIKCEIQKFCSDPVHIRKMLARITAICILYEDPMAETSKFSTSYEVLGFIAQRMETGEYLNIPNKKTKELDAFKIKMSVFAELERLGEIYLDVSNSCEEDKKATFKIPHITYDELGKLENNL